MEPIPHWPGEFVSLGGYGVFVRSVPAEPHNPELDSPGPGLCVHGLSGSSRNWTDLMDALRPRVACDAIDLPGFGESRPRPDGKYSISAMAQTVATLIERRDRGPVHLIGNSLGGAISLKVAATRPELVRSLTLISPALPDSRLRFDLVQFPLLCVPLLGSRMLARALAIPPERRVAAVFAACYYDASLLPPARFADEVAALRRQDTLGYAHSALLGCIRSLVALYVRGGGLPAWREAARVTAPTLVIYGSDDRLVSPRMAGRAAVAFGGARIAVLPRTGHVAQMEHPAAVAAQIAGLLEGSGRPAGPESGPGQDREPREFPLAPAG